MGRSLGTITSQGLSSHEFPELLKEQLEMDKQATESPEHLREVGEIAQTEMLDKF